MGLDLQSGRSYWLLKNTRLPEYPELEGDERADVVIVGGGVTGALAAALLVEAGFEVIVLDRRALGCGSTGASTALLAYETDLSLAQIAAIHGHDAAVRSYALAREANVALRDLTDRLGIECGFEAASSFHVARTEPHSATLQLEHRLRNESGFPCEHLGARELSHRYGIAADSALLSAEAAQVDPVRLTAGLLEFVTAHGSRCYRAHVTDVEAAPAQSVVTTQQGARLRARRVVFATGYETQQRLRQRSVQLVSTYAIATGVVAAMPTWLPTAIFWDTDQPYHYARSVDGRMLVGGGDEPFVDERARDALMPQKADALLGFLHGLLPWISTDVYTAWCGTFARTADSLPYLGAPQDTPDVFYSLGYGGNGITFGMLGALYLRDEMTGRRSRDLALFSFERDRIAPRLG